MTKDTGSPKILKSKPDAPKQETKIVGGGRRFESEPEIKKQGRRGG